MKILISENLKKLREEKGMTQSELADSLSVTPQSVSRWEKGLAYPDIEKLPQLSKWFDVSIDELMGNCKSKLHSITEELIKIRTRLYENPEDSVRKKYLDLLEESVNIGSNRFLCEYYNASRKMKKDKIVSVEKYSKAKETVCKKLLEMKPYERANALAVIVANEDEENFAFWEEFIGNDNNRACWNDILLLRHFIRNDEKNFDIQRREVVFQDVSKILYLINQKSAPNSSSGEARSQYFDSTDKITNCLLAKSLIESLSTRDDDIFIFHRITAETRLASTYIELSDVQNTARCLDRIKELLTVCKNVVGKTLKGSIDLFADYELFAEEYQYENTFFEIEVLINSKAYLSMKVDNEPLNAFVSFISRLHGEIDPFCYLPWPERKHFEKLYEQALTLAKRSNTSEVYAFVVETDKGNIYEGIDRFTQDSDNDIRLFLDILKNNNDTNIKYIVGFIYDSQSQICLEMPSHLLRTKLCDMNKLNLNADLLLKGYGAFIKKSIKDTFSTMFQTKYE